MRGTRWLLLVAIAAILGGIGYKYRLQRDLLLREKPPAPETLAAELLVQRVDGRQLLPAVGSPGGPEEEQHHLPAKVGESLRLPSEVGQVERRRRLRLVVALHLHRREIRCARRRGPTA